MPSLGSSQLELRASEAGADPNARIGIFDSGVGGITVLRELYRHLPAESVLYFADTARLPYGTRSQAEIVQFAREILHWMVAQHVKIAIMACNTCSALALEVVRHEFDIPILSPIAPASQAAVAQGGRIGTIATPATAASNAYKRAIHAIDSSASVWQVGCPEFVPLVEQNRITDPYAYRIAQQYLAPLQARGINTLIYGCTHYPHLAPVLQAILAPQVRTIDPAHHVVALAERELAQRNLKSTHPAQPTRFCVSGSPQQFAQLSRQWLGCTPQVERVDLAATRPVPFPSASGAKSAAE